MGAEEFQALQGMSDLGPPEIHLWQDVEAGARRIFSLYGFEEIRTPILERTSLFQRSLGETTEVVQKEMYAFEDRGGREICLRPEGTAGVMRYIASLGQEGQSSRVFYLGPMFRAERPQAGRKRQFHQIGAEAIGPALPAADAEMIALQVHLLQSWGLRGFRVQVNTRGLAEDQKNVVAGLRRVLEPRLAELGVEDQRRFQTNVLRVLDTKDEQSLKVVRELPPITQFMAESTRDYLEQVRAVLAKLEIQVELNPLLIRGLDYYVHTVWEITHAALGAQDALSGGGRYRIHLGDREVEGVGFAMGMERLITALQSDRAGEETGREPLVWIVSLGERALVDNIRLAQSLRRREVRCGMDLAGRSMKAQMRAADRAGAARVIIRGDSEMEKGTFVLKDMAAGGQQEMTMPELIERLKALNPSG
jgi:histidyl-tRNA synthetase